MGIQIQYLTQAVVNTARRQDIDNSYKHLIHKFITSWTNNIRDEIYPEYYTGIHGILIPKKSVQLILRKIDTTLYNTSVTNMFYFISSICCDNVSDDDVVFQECIHQLPFLQRKCIDVGRIREEGINSERTNNAFIYNSPSLIKSKVNRLVQMQEERVQRVVELMPS